MLRLSAEKYGMKVKLLNDGGYMFSLSHIKFPIIVIGKFIDSREVLIEVKGSELNMPDKNDSWLFSNGRECEVINE